MKERVRGLLEAGWTRSAVARELGVDPTTITRCARLLGFQDVRPRESPIDWATVRAYYDAGHTIYDCKQRFGFSLGAWDKAVARGELVVRERSDGRLSHETRDAVEQLIAQGTPPADIAGRLGLSKSTIAYHRRQLGVRADPRFAMRYDWGEVQRAVDQEGLSMTQCINRFGFCRVTWGNADKRGDVLPRASVTPMDELLVAGRARQRGHVKARLLREGLKAGRCEICGVDEWLGRPLSLELHHVNGDGDDNRLENLQLLRGNCHSQTDNWGGRGVRALRKGDDESRG